MSVRIRFQSAPPVKTVPPSSVTQRPQVQDLLDISGEKSGVQSGPVKKWLGTVIGVVSLALSLVSMGMLRLPKVPVLSAPFFAIVLGAFAANEALIAAADAAGIPTIHHTESLRKVLTAPGYWFSKNVLEPAWPVFYGGQKEKKAYLENFAKNNEGLVTMATRLLVQNPIFEDLSEKLRDKRNFKEKALEIGQSFGKVLLALAAGSILPKPLRQWAGPWLTNLVGFPVMQRILDQLDQDPSTPGIQLTRNKAPIAVKGDALLPKSLDKKVSLNGLQPAT